MLLNKQKVLLAARQIRDQDIHTMKPAAGQPRRNEYGRECMKVTYIFFRSNIPTVYSGHRGCVSS